MQKINTIAKLTIEVLESNNILPTPINFEREFFNQLNKSKLIIEEPNELKELFELLTKNEKSNLNDNIKTYASLAKILINRVDDEAIKRFLKDLFFFFSPSLNNSIKEDLNLVFESIANNPSSLFEDSVVRKLREITNKRISKDRNDFDEKTLDIKKLIHFIDSFLNRSIDEENSSLNKVIEIKKEIEDLNLSKSSNEDLDIIHEKLLEKIKKFERILDDKKRVMLNNKKESSILYKQIEQLQKDLDKAEEEKSIDFLTKVLTRRAYMLELDRIEKEYNIYSSNYAIVFYDIDFFKKINDKYGHECGDYVLSTFASILQKLTRSGDIIARFGGEEFIAIINYKNKFEVTNYLKRVKNIVSSNNIVFKENKINLQFSAGVVFRKNYSSYSEAFDNADKLLYSAKEKGRNKIILDNKIEI